MTVTAGGWPTLAPMLVCPSCGASAPAGARYCPACATPVAGAQPEERRIVTVLFADLVGFTTLSEHLDPEQVKRLVDHCFERLVDVVEEFGGVVDKLMGDGMLALFGAPVAHEDDPARAVHAALRMQQVLADSDTAMAAGAAVQMRVGINTGEVLVGTLAGTDYTAMGDVVNTASRLQAAAPAGGVLVGRATYGLTSHSFRYEPHGRVRAKGREQAVDSWLAVAPTALPGARRRRSDLPLVGRDTELALAESALALTTDTRRSVLLHLVGESGVGKTRLVDEVTRRLKSDRSAAVLRGACVPYGETNVWLPLASAIADHLDIDVADPPDVVRATTLRRTVDLLGSPAATLPAGPAGPAPAVALEVAAPAGPPTIAVTPPRHDEVERIVDVIVHLLGIASPIDRLDASTARGLIHDGLTSLLAARADHGPLVLSIDDLHWADQAVLDLLEHLVHALARHDFALITATRPAAEHEWPPRVERTTVVSLTLQPLSRADSERLARTVAGDEHLDDSRLAALYDRSGGNPLFLIELMALTEGGGLHELPDSLRSLIAARLDRLTVDQRQMLENAAVLGTAGRVTALEQFAAGLQQQFVDGTLLELDELGLLEVHGSRWEFRSDSVRDAAYQTLTKTARAVRHAKVAEAIDSVPGLADDRAHHLAAAAELVQEIGQVTDVPADIARQALDALRSAADRAVEGGSLRMAMRHASRALHLVEAAGADDDVIAHLYLVRGTAGVERRDVDTAAADIDSLQRLAISRDDPLLLAQAHRLRGMLAHGAGRADEARRELGAAIELLRREDRPETLARALRERGFIEMFGGSLKDAEWFFGEADQLYRTLGDDRGLALIEQHRAWIALSSGDLDTAHQRLTHAATALGQLGDRTGVAWAYGLLAFVEFFERHFDRAESLADTVRNEAEVRGDAWAVGMMDALLAQLRLWRGALDEAHALAERARARFKRLNDQYGLVHALGALLRAQVALGRVAASQRSVEELTALADGGRHGPLPLQALAGAAMHRGHGAPTIEFAQRALDIIDASGALMLEPYVLVAIGHLQRGDVDAAMLAADTVPAPAGSSPFADAVEALVRCAAGQYVRARDLAEGIAAITGATYLDDVLASVAIAGACSGLGEPEGAVAAAEAAAVRAVAAGDVVAIALASAVYHRLTGRVHPQCDPRHQLAEGWSAVVGLVLAGAPTATG